MASPVIFRNLFGHDALRLRSQLLHTLCSHPRGQEAGLWLSHNPP
ncbi:hypothetical protein [Pseudanabaena sp. FACHB-2040]|nr:hypothetical protein [Pseudanabaena sp. FACHB-2040]